MTRNRSGHSRRLRVGDGMRSPSVWHFVKRFAPCPSGTLSGQNRHRTVPFHLHPPATHLAMQPASRLRHPLPGLQRSQRRSVRHRPHPSGVGDRNAERPRPARRNRRPAKAPPHHRLLAVAVRGGIRTQTPITDGGGAPGPFSLMVINSQGWAGLGLDRGAGQALCYAGLYGRVISTLFRHTE